MKGRFVFSRNKDSTWRAVKQLSGLTTNRGCPERKGAPAAGTRLHRPAVTRAAPAATEGRVRSFRSDGSCCFLHNPLMNPADGKNQEPIYKGSSERPAPSEISGFPSSKVGVFLPNRGAMRKESSPRGSSGPWMCSEVRSGTQSRPRRASGDAFTL